MDSLSYARKLKLLGIGIQFEENGINTLALGDEMLLSTFAAIAQEESKAISQNQRLSFVKRMESGEYVDSNAPYGYRLRNKQLEIYEPEAEVVRTIYQLYLNGWSTSEIARELTSKGVPTKLGNEIWKPFRVSYILSNERYIGDSLYQKTCRDTTVPFKQSVNRGQEELVRRKAIVPQFEKKALTPSGKYSRYALTDVLMCGECGSRYKRVTWTNRGKKKIVWRCINRLENGTKYCKESLSVDEATLHSAIVRAINHFNEEDETTYLTLMKATIGDAIGLNGGSDEVDILERRIAVLDKRTLELINESVSAGTDFESHEDEFRDLSEEKKQLERRIAAIKESLADDESVRHRLSEIEATIEERAKNKDTYDDAIVRQMIECIRVYHAGRLEIIFGGGHEVEEHL